MPPPTRLAGDAPDERSPLLNKRSGSNAVAASSSSSADPSNSDQHPNIQYVRDSDEEDNLNSSEEEALLRSDVSKLPSPPPGARVAAPDELEDALNPAERRRHTLKWLAFWIVFGIFTIVLVVLAVKKGGAKFDFKDALKKAAGGVSEDPRFPLSLW